MEVIDVAETSVAVKKRKNTWKNYLYLMPAVLFIGIFFITSIVFTIRTSFYEWDGITDMKFVGLENYIELFQDPNFRISVMNTVCWVLGSLVISFFIPLLFAILITKSSWLTGFKNIFYFPTALSATIGGLIMATLLSTYGIPQILGALGFEKLACDWLAIPYVNTFVMIAMNAWQGIGLNMILFISGLKNLPSSPVEAAKIEGANTFQMYFKVIFPLLKSTMVVVLLTSLVNSFKIFDSIWVMTKGGPYRTSETLALTMYIESFVRNHLGTGSAVAVVLTVIILIVSYFNLRNSFKED